MEQQIVLDGDRDRLEDAPGIAKDAWPTTADTGWMKDLHRTGRDLAHAARLRRPDLRVLDTIGYTENAIVHHGRLDPGVRLLSKSYHRQA